MNDTEILDSVLLLLKGNATDMRPLSPSSAGAAVDFITQQRGSRKPAFQDFWRCSHFPSAINNFFDSDLRGGCDECKQATS